MTTEPTEVKAKEKVRKDMLVQHVRPRMAKVEGKKRRPLGTPCGTLVALKNAETGEVTIGWSKRHPIHEPKTFTKKRGIAIATGRAKTGSMIVKTFCQYRSQKANAVDGMCLMDNKRTLPYSLITVIPKFVERAEKYFETSVTNFVEE